MAKKKNQNKKGSNRGTDMVVYRGPIRIGNSVQPQSVRVNLKQVFNVSSAAAGYLEVYSNTTRPASTPEWASMASNFREYRVLGIRSEYVPNYDSSGFNGTGRALQPGAAAVYHGPDPAWQGAVTTSSVQNTFLMEGSRPFHPCKGCVLEWRMGDVEEAQFFSTSTSSAVGGVYSVSGTVTASVPFGVQFITTLVEFKGRV